MISTRPLFDTSGLPFARMPRCLLSTLIVGLSLQISGCEQKPPRPPAPATSPQSVSPNTNKSAAPATPAATPTPAPDASATAVTAAASPDDWFEDMTDACGLNFQAQNGREGHRYFMIESFGCGVAVIDFDGDGDADLFFTGGGTISRDDPVAIQGLPSALYRNDGNWKLVNRTPSAGLSAAPDYSQGCTVTDFNADGLPDLFVCCLGRNRLYQNQGDGTFTAMEFLAESQPDTWSTTATFADMDADGLPDLWVAHYAAWSVASDRPCRSRNQRDLCGPTTYNPTRCQFFHNGGDGSFEDWSDRIGVSGPSRGLGILATDLNLDGYVDVYIANDVTPNQLYRGGPQFPLTESGAASGVAFNEWGQPEGSMGVAAGDYNGDGLPDLWVTNFELEDNALYQNLGDGNFLHSTVSAGLGGVSRMRVGFGTAMTDLDGDGWLDLFVLNGNPIYQVAETPYKQPAQLFQNQGGRFKDVTAAGGPFFRQSYSGRGNAVVDLDDDGAPDMITVPLEDTVRVLRNRRVPANHVSIELRALKGEPDATGARVSIEYQGRTLVRFLTRGAGFFSESDHRLILPLAPDAKEARITVEWPGRGREQFLVAARQRQRLLEGSGEVVHE